MFLTELSIAATILFFLCANAHMPGQIIIQIIQAEDKTIPLICCYSFVGKASKCVFIERQNTGACKVLICEL